MRGEHERFPDFAFLDFAIAQQGIHVDILSQIFRALGHARRTGNALAERAGAHVHAGHEVHIRVALQIAVRVAQRRQVAHREEAAIGQRAVKARRRVALGEHETISVGLFRLFGIDTQLFVIQIGEHLCGRQASARMARLGAVRRFNDAHADLAGSDRELLLFLIGHNFLLETV